MPPYLQVTELLKLLFRQQCFKVVDVYGCLQFLALLARAKICEFVRGEELTESRRDTVPAEYAVAIGKLIGTFHCFSTDLTLSFIHIGELLDLGFD